MQTLTCYRLPRTVAVISLVAVLSVLHCGTAHATVLTWTLQDATFRDGTLAVGTFTFDFVTDSVINFDISVSQGPGPFSALHYTASTAIVDRSNRTFFSLLTTQPLVSGTSRDLRHFDLGFGTFINGCFCSLPLPETGGTVPIFVFAGSREQFGDEVGVAIRWIDSGTVVAASSVPEPGSVTLILAGLAAIASKPFWRTNSPPQSGKATMKTG